MRDECIVTGDDLDDNDDDPEFTEPEFTEEERQTLIGRYYAAAHAIQSGIAWKMGI